MIVFFENLIRNVAISRVSNMVSDSNLTYVSLPGDAPVSCGAPDLDTSAPGHNLCVQECISLIGTSRPVFLLNSDGSVQEPRDRTTLLHHLCFTAQVTQA